MQLRHIEQPDRQRAKRAALVVVLGTIPNYDQQLAREYIDSCFATSMPFDEFNEIIQSRELLEEELRRWKIQVDTGAT